MGCRQPSIIEFALKERRLSDLTASRLGYLTSIVKDWEITGWMTETCRMLKQAEFWLVACVVLELVEHSCALENWSIKKSWVDRKTEAYQVAEVVLWREKRKETTKPEIRADLIVTKWPNVLTYWQQVIGLTRCEMTTRLLELSPYLSQQDTLTIRSCSVWVWSPFDEQLPDMENQKKSSTMTPTELSTRHTLTCAWYPLWQLPSCQCWNQAELKSSNTWCLSVSKSSAVAFD